LHRLRAQVHFEELLMLLTLGPNTRNRGGGDDHQSILARQRFNAKFVDHARIGLRSLRDARDNLLAREGVPLLRDPRVIELRQLWFQFLVACACNAWIRERANTHTEAEPKSAFERSFWQRWNWLNTSAGLKELVDEATLQQSKAYLEPVLDAMEPVSSHSLSARCFVERQIKLFCTALVPVRNLEPEARVPTTAS
ncbi:MAG: hypothetical protein P4L84_34830, partial [Isosphaeraceae bacterium]|nr:hypothetical protein [Isosphaeraceae bacterium]